MITHLVSLMIAQVYLEDSLGERVWVDRQGLQGFCTEHPVSI